MPILNGITVFPIKSLNGTRLNQVRMLENGALEHDRQYTLFDSNDSILNAKKTAEFHRIHAEYDLSDMSVSLSINGLSGYDSFILSEQQNQINEWFSDYFAQNLRLVENKEGGFPDDTVYPGPTIISSQTLRAVSTCFADINVEELRDRLRTNLEIDTDTAFWEDHLFAESDKNVNFKIGDALFSGGNPCQRCIVPVRNTKTGQEYNGFQQKLMRFRKDSLPGWSTQSRFDHYYRLAVNLKISKNNTCDELHLYSKLELL